MLHLHVTMRILAAFTEATRRAHQAALQRLADDADARCQAANATGPWTDKPGGEALAAMAGAAVAGGSR